MRILKLTVVLVVAAVAGPALAEPPANVIDVAPSATPTPVVVLRGSSAPPQPWGGAPASQSSNAPQAPAVTYSEPAYAPVYFLPGFFQTRPQRDMPHVPPPPQVAPPYPIRPWGVGLAPFQR
jgi:hypothetical protein